MSTPCADFTLEQTSSTLPTLPAELITVVYEPDSTGQVHTQPLTDITDAGTLIDPDTGDDLVIAGIVDQISEHQRLEVTDVQDGLPLRLAFGKNAVREHFDDGDEASAFLTTLTAEELRGIGLVALTDDRLYAAFHEVLVDAVRTLHGRTLD